MMTVLSIKNELKEELTSVLQNYELVCKKIARIEKQVENCSEEFYNMVENGKANKTLYKEYSDFKQESNRRLQCYESIKENLESLIWNFTMSIDCDDMVKNKNEAIERFNNIYK